MIVAGCDVGSRTSKSVIMENSKIISCAVIPSSTKPGASAQEVMNLALTPCKLVLEDLEHVVGTGYGKEHINFAVKTVSEISCHAKAAYWNTPSVRMIIDIGGQDSKAIKIDDQGNVIRYIYNDKCAAGTGRFLEVMADALEVRLEDMGEIGKQSIEKLSISNQCVIFAETEVVSLVNEGREVPDIINALHHSMANRVASLAKSIGVEEDVVLCGGVAKNIGMFEALAQALKVSVKGLENVDPQLNGAVGAALMALDSSE